MLNTWQDSEIWVIISESTGSSQEKALEEMKNSSIVRCLLSKESNTEEENEFFKKILSNLFASQRFNTITYESIRRNPNWQTLSDKILKEEVIAQKPHDSGKGWSTFIVGEVRQTYLIRVVREIWAFHVLSTKFIPLWTHNYYRPNRGGYVRVRDHYNIISKS